MHRGLLRCPPAHAIRHLSPLPGRTGQVPGRYRGASAHLQAAAYGSPDECRRAFGPAVRRSRAGKRARVPRARAESDCDLRSASSSISPSFTRPFEDRAEPAAARCNDALLIASAHRRIYAVLQHRPDQRHPPGPRHASLEVRKFGDEVGDTGGASHQESPAPRLPACRAAAAQGSLWSASAGRRPGALFGVRVRRPRSTARRSPTSRAACPRLPTHACRCCGSRRRPRSERAVPSRAGHFGTYLYCIRPAPDTERSRRMVVEYIRYTVRAEQAGAFESAYAHAPAIVRPGQALPGLRGRPRHRGARALHRPHRMGFPRRPRARLPRVTALSTSSSATCSRSSARSTR